MSSALTSGLLTFMFCVLSVVFYYDASTSWQGVSVGRSMNKPARVQMATNLLWIGTPTKVSSSQDSSEPSGSDTSTRPKLKIRGPNILFSVGITGVNQWYALLSASLFFPALIFCRSRSGRQEKRQLYLLLGFQASTMLLVFAVDLVVLVIGLQLTALFYWLLSYSNSEADAPRRDSQFLGISLTISSAMMLFGCVTLVAAVIAFRSGPVGMLGSPSFSIPFITSYLPRKLADDPAAANFWVSMAPWTGFSLFAGLLLRCAAFPAHNWWEVHAKLPVTALSAIFGMIIVNTGFFVIVSLFLPLFRTEMTVAAPYICLFFSAAALLAAIRLLGENEPQQLVVRSASVVIQFSLVGLFSMNSVGQTGAIMTGMISALLVALFFLRSTMQAYAGELARMEFGILDSCIACIGLLPGLLLIVIGVARIDSPSSFWIILLFVTSLGILLKECFKQEFVHPKESALAGPGFRSDLKFVTTVCCCFLFAAILFAVFGLSFLSARISQMLAITAGIG